MSDHTEVGQIQLRMMSSTKKLNDMAPSLGMAKQVREFSSDRRKQILAVEMVKAMKTEKSATAAEAIARASDLYRIAMDEQAKQLADAETVIATWQATEASFEASRSLLSMQKEGLKRL
jgi:hypothetical protein